MGVGASIVMEASDERTATAAARAAQQRVERLESVLSDYRMDSEVSRLPERLASSHVAEISPTLARTAGLSRGLRHRTGGAFDERLGELTRAWRDARRAGEPPDTERTRAAWKRSRVEYQVRDQPQPPTLTAEGPIWFDFGGIGKGLACDEAAAVLRSHGIERFLIDLGGDLLAGDPPTGKPGWRIAIDALEYAPLSVELSHAAIATSGARYQSLIIDGVEHSHILDPRTGDPVTTLRGVTVIASNGATADALASALSVLGESGGSLMRIEFLDAHWRILERSSDGSIREIASERFPR